MISNEVEEREKDDIQFLEAGEDAPEAHEPAKEPLDFLAPLVEDRNTRLSMHRNEDLGLIPITSSSY